MNLTRRNFLNLTSQVKNGHVATHVIAHQDRLRVDGLIGGAP
jgi:predicted site-specific integrase-resolvase